MTPSLDAIGITTADMAASCRFYALLGVPVGTPTADDDHFEATLPSGVRLMWDSVEMMKQIDPDWQPPAGQRLNLAFHCGTAAGVDERLAEAGAVRVGDVSGAAGWAYVRYRELLYSEDELDAIATELSELAGRGIETFAYFRHGDDPDAPAAALRVTGLGY